MNISALYCGPLGNRIVRTVRKPLQRAVFETYTDPYSRSMPKPSLFGTRLAEVRGIRGLTQQQLADAAGVPAAVISHFETGVRSSASADNLVKLADALHVSVDYLLGRTEDMTPIVDTTRDARAKLSDDQIRTLDLLTQTFLARRAKPDINRGE